MLFFYFSSEIDKDMDDPSVSSFGNCFDPHELSEVLSKRLLTVMLPIVMERTSVTQSF